MTRIKILHNAMLVGKTSFGVGHIAVNLAQTQYALGHDVKMWCLDSNENILWASETHDFPAERITGFKLTGPPKLWFSPEMNNYAQRNAQSMFEIVHQHGIWTGVSKTTLICSRKKIPTVVAPHGSLNEWVLKLSGWKKKIALSLYERDNLNLASCLHATAENEISDFRNFGLKNPIAYIQNGIQEKKLSVTGNAARFREQHGIHADKRVLLFLSRVSPKKGLTMLLDAIHSIPKDFANWQLIIAGSDEFNHTKEIEEQIKQLKLEESIKIVGTLFDQAKDDAFAAAELFILPSYSEGFPMVVLESLGAGVPVITTRASAWNDLLEFNCGWWTNIDTGSLRIALKEALNKSPEDLALMGEHGKSLIASKFTWSQMAKQTIRLYEWLLGRDNKPDFVELH